MVERTRVFVSYSHQDREWLERLQVHLRPLERAGLIERWDDTRLAAGARWREEIRAALASTRVAVLLVSADLLASEFIHTEELPPLLAAAHAQGAVILPVILSPCRFEQSELGQFQSVNPPNEPLIGLPKAEQEAMFVAVVEAVERALSPAPAAGPMPAPGPSRAVSAAGRPVCRGTGRHLPSALGWLARNPRWVFSGVGVAILMALLSWLLSLLKPEPAGNVSARGGVAAGGDIRGSAITIVAPPASDSTDSKAPEAPALAQVVQRFGGQEGIGPGFFKDTQRLAVDGAGNIYTGDYRGGRIQLFGATGNFLSQMNVGDDVLMRSMTVDRQGIVYVGDGQTILRFDGATGAALDPLPYQMNVATMTTAPDGSLIILAADLVAGDRLLRLDGQGNLTLDLTDPFADIVDFAMTHEDVAADGAGNIYVLGSETVYKLDRNGRFINRFGSPGDGDDQFHSTPTSLAVDGQGHIYVDDFYGIKVFDGTGRYLATIPFIGAAFDMLFTSRNQLLVMDRNGNQVLTYELNQNRRAQ